VRLRLVSICLLLVPLSVLLGQARSSSGPKHHTEQSAASASHASPIDPGERVFNANCARCHTPPMIIPPKIAGTLIMHMRVRASLSRQDELVLLKFIAP
jgi:cytochrome c5